MTKIYYNKEEVIHNVITNLTDAINSVSNAKNIALSFNTPTTFELYGLINSMAETLQNDLSKITEIKEQLSTTIIEYERLVIELNKDLNKIDDIKLKENNNIIKAS